MSLEPKINNKKKVSNTYCIILLICCFFIVTKSRESLNKSCYSSCCFWNIYDNTPIIDPTGLGIFLAIGAINFATCITYCPLKCLLFKPSLKCFSEDTTFNFNNKMLSISYLKQGMVINGVIIKDIIKV